MERTVRHVDDPVKAIRVLGKDTMGCQRHQRDVLMILTREGEDDWHDWFLSTSQVKELIRDLQEVLQRNDELDIRERNREK